ncbi:MAG: hypothetical protein Q8N83_11575 [Ignavibacteria bacterium]|nr:hypothetical protein [Ignavibacteria bacterium]
MVKKVTFFVVLFLFGLIPTTFAQISSVVSEVKIGVAKENETLTIEARFQPSSSVTKAVIGYRSFGQNEFTYSDMIVQGSSAFFTIPAAEVLPPNIEYFMKFSMTTGAEETYPEEFLKSNTPIQIQVQGVSGKDKEVLVMSPEKGEKILTEEFFISISLLRASDIVNKSATKIYLDNKDITNLALFADDIIIISPENFQIQLKDGLHNLSVELYDTTNTLYHSVSSQFVILNPSYALLGQSAINYAGDVRLESRNENIQTVGTWYNNLNVNLQADYKGFNLLSNVYVTSEEKKYLQPNNRYMVSLSNDYAAVTVGDHYPKYPSLVLNGKRVRGFSGEVNLGFFNIQTSFGEISRDVEGTFIQYKDTLGGNIIAVDSIKHNGNKYAEVYPGTFKRSLLAIRPSFGRGENFQFGLSFLHVKDETGSIEYGTAPKENLVLGTDLMFGFDNQNILFTTQAAFSLLNNDISQGSLTDSQIVSIFGPDGLININPEDVKKLRDQVSGLFTVNQYVTPLNPQKLPSLAAEAALSFNYFDNYLKGSYVYRGDQYSSFGQSYVRTDVAGINVLDRLRLFENKFFVSLGFENLQDNLQKTKRATTTFQTLNTSVSFYPRTNLPSIIVGYTRLNNTNGLSPIKDPADSTAYLSAIDDITNRISTQLSYNFEWHYRHSVSLSFVNSTRDDKSYANYDIENSSVTVSSGTRWFDNLSSSFNISMNNSKVDTTSFSYVSLSLGANYSMLQEKLLLSGSLSPSFGDYKRTSFDASALYYLMPNLTLQLQFRYLNYDYTSSKIDQVTNIPYAVKAKANDVIVGLTTQLYLQ